jgi:ankyrin repeat protein
MVCDLHCQAVVLPFMSFKHPKLLNELIKGRSYLHYACDYGQYDIIEYLLNKGANLNVRIISSWPTSINQCRCGFFKWCKFSFGSFKLEDKYNIRPLLAAIWENHESCVNLLLKKVNLLSRLNRWWLQVNNRLIFEGADKNIKAPDGKAIADCTDNENIRALLHWTPFIIY